MRRGGPCLRSRMAVKRVLQCHRVVCGLRRRGSSNFSVRGTTDVIGTHLPKSFENIVFHGVTDVLLQRRHGTAPPATPVSPARCANKVAAPPQLVARPAPHHIGRVGQEEGQIPRILVPKYCGCLSVHCREVLPSPSPGASGTRAGGGSRQIRRDTEPGPVCAVAPAGDLGSHLGESATGEIGADRVEPVVALSADALSIRLAERRLPRSVRTKLLAVVSPWPSSSVVASGRPKPSRLSHSASALTTRAEWICRFEKYVCDVRLLQAIGEPPEAPDVHQDDCGEAGRAAPSATRRVSVRRCSPMSGQRVSTRLRCAPLRRFSQ